jgi:SAM-dependent methyltransferase
MGFGTTDLRFLFSAEKLGFSGIEICTLGKLTSYTGQRALNAVLREWNKPQFLLPKNKALYTVADYLEPLGYRVTSIDASSYEGADVIHDLNCPIPDKFIGRFDLVIDGGTLEHVFNYPQALQNAMRLLRVGGHLFLATPTNNQCGHGFYQFSPELFYSVLTERNGFELKRIYIRAEGRKFFHVADPSRVGGRVELLNSSGSSLLVHAVKLKDAPFAGAQQSDYLVDWNRSPPQDGRIKALLRRTLSNHQIIKISYLLNQMRVKRAARNWKRNSRLSNKRFYIPVSDWTQPTRDAFGYVQTSMPPSLAGTQGPG